MLTEAIQVLKQARRRALGEVTTMALAVDLLKEEAGEVAVVYFPDSALIRERISVVVDALAFHAGEICDKPDTIHGVITLLSEIRNALGEASRAG